MNFIEFRNKWHALGCINVNQIYAWRPEFERSNLNQWMKKGYIVKLRKEFYAFSDYLEMPGFARYVANRIYLPSYVSLHSALSFYGMIPEEVVQLTSVTSLKTKQFLNPFGQFAYHNVKPEMMFGYELRPMDECHSILMATPEKALLDLLYLYPFYKTPRDMEELRLDEDFLTDDFDRERFTGFADRLGRRSLIRRADILLKTYGL